MSVIPYKLTFILSHSMYNKDSQVKQVKKLLSKNIHDGHPVIEDTPSGHNFFTKGHLVPSSDFVYYAEKYATYYFINTAPQFYSFNNINWNSLEQCARDYADKVKKTFNVFPGTYGQLKFDGNPMFLYKNTHVPVPEYFWKVIEDPVDMKAVAFIGSNDIYLSSSPMLFCENVCSQIPWVQWNIEKIYSGYMYCCEVKKLRETISYLPDLLNHTLLTS